MPSDFTGKAVTIELPTVGKGNIERKDLNLQVGMAYMQRPGAQDGLSTNFQLSKKFYINPDETNNAFEARMFSYLAVDPAIKVQGNGTKDRSGSHFEASAGKISFVTIETREKHVTEKVKTRMNEYREKLYHLAVSRRDIDLSFNEDKWTRVLKGSNSNAEEKNRLLQGLITLPKLTNKKLN
jgi:hypothetical protein